MPHQANEATRVLPRVSGTARHTLASLAALILFAAASSPSLAATVYYEQGNLIRSGETVSGLGPDLMGDKVNEYNGGSRLSS